MHRRPPQNGAYVRRVDPAQGLKDVSELRQWAEFDGGGNGVPDKDDHLGRNSEQDSEELDLPNPAAPIPAVEVTEAAQTAEGIAITEAEQGALGLTSASSSYRSPDTHAARQEGPRREAVVDALDQNI